jgi:3',5'-cyclic AMP phosphodiesterase CpdA
MKIISIPDLHGKDAWKQVDVARYDKVIFLGDYVDSNEITGDVIIENLKEIIALKKLHSDKVELLLGNHDMQYMFYPKFRCSGFMIGFVKQLDKLFNEHKSIFKYAFQIDNHLWTHAGITNAWYQDNLEVFKRYTDLDPKKDLAEILNRLGISYPHVMDTTSLARKGSDKYSSILWADITETSEDLLKDYHQYVGHSRVPEITYLIGSNLSMHYLDCLNNKVEFYEIEL